jgi:large subunit ribosomal protein L35
VPKMKTHSGAKKRVKISGAGRYLRRQSGRGHYRLAKGNDVFRRRAGEVELGSGDARVAKRLMGI